MRILVIEDNESVSSMIELFFLKEEIDGSFIKNGLEGFELAKQGGWDCIIIDWMLPGMDGISICHKLRLANIATPIIMLTAKDGESDQVLGLEMGADDYVTKPFSPLALMARIKAVTRRYSTLKDKPLQDGVVETAHFKINLNTRDVLLDGVPDTKPDSKRIRSTVPFCPASETSFLT